MTGRKQFEEWHGYVSLEERRRAEEKKKADQEQRIMYALNHKNYRISNVAMMKVVQQELHEQEKKTEKIFIWFIRTVIAFFPVTLYLFFKYSAGPEIKPITGIDSKLSLYVFVMFGISIILFICWWQAGNKCDELEAEWYYWRNGGGKR